METVGVNKAISDSDHIFGVASRLCPQQPGCAFRLCSGAPVQRTLVPNWKLEAKPGRVVSGRGDAPRRASLVTPAGLGAEAGLWPVTVCVSSP